MGEKEKNCDPGDRTPGDCWDPVALDPESRLVASPVVGKRTDDATHTLVGDFHRRTGGRAMRPMTSDEYPVYATAIRRTYGRTGGDAAPHGPTGPTRPAVRGGPAGADVRDGPRGPGEQPGGGRYDFCWPVETLRERDADGRWRSRTPAMAAGLTDHVWSLAEWLAYPAVQRK